MLITRTPQPQLGSLTSLQESTPNFRDKNGALHLVHCYRCGRENYALSVPSGECYWCSWREGISAGIGAEQVVTWQHDETGMIFTKNIPISKQIPIFPRRSIIKIEWLLGAQIAKGEQC